MSSGPTDGFLRLDDVVVLRLSGSQTRPFLSRQLTCDVAALTPGRPLFGAWLNPKGRAIVLLRVVELGDGTLRVLLPAELADDVARRMRLFVLRDDVAIDRAEDEEVLGLAGQCVQRLADQVDASGTLVPVAADPPLALFVAGKESTRSCAERLDDDGYAALSPQAWDLLLVRAGLPEVVNATREAFVPQMINLDALGAVSFRKGCYPGQEIVARTQHLGRIKRRTFMARCDGSVAAAPGDALVTEGPGDATGRVVRAAAGPDGQELLAVLPLDAVAAGARFRLGDANGPAVQVAPPPYSLDATEH